MKKLIFFPIFFFAVSLLAQEVNVVIEVGTSPFPGKKRVTVKYAAIGGDFEPSNGTDEWNAQTITLGWLSSTGMYPSAPGTNPDITSFTSPSGFSFVDNFTGNNNIISYTLDQLGGTNDGKVYTTFVVNGSTSNQPIMEGSPLTVFFFDIPSSWGGGPGSLFLLANQPPGILIGLAPTILNSVLGQVWDGIEVAAALPIELLSFAASPIDNRDALLEWATSSELNSDKFEVERSNDGRQWNFIGNVKAAGFSQQELNYQLLDRQVFDPARPSSEALFYYRLRMVDLDGTFSFSEMRKVEFESSHGLFIGELFPNPSSRGSTQINLPIATENPSELGVKIIDGQGRMVMFDNRPLEPGDQLIGFDLFFLPAGVYHMQLSMDGQRFSKKFIVQ